MNNVVKCANLHGINDLRYEDICVAEARDDEVLMEVKSCGICGSDVSRVYEKGTYHFPTVIGHEFAGKIVYDPKGELTGKRAVVFPLIPCFKCKCCENGNYATCESYDYYGSRRDGGMTEAINVKRWNVLEMPDEISYDEGAMCEPISVALHAASKLGIKCGDNVLISGAGPIGLIVGQWANELGAKKVYYIDIDKRKTEFAEKMGFLEYVDGVDVDCALEGTGCSDALENCLDAIKPHGNLVLMGNPGCDIVLRRNVYWNILRKELKIHGTWNSSYNDIENDWKKSLKALKEGKINVKPLITHRYPLERCREAFEMMRQRREFYNKVMLNMNEEEK